jgi:uncharacterized protein YchJ
VRTNIFWPFSFTFFSQILRRVKYQAGTDKVAADFRERSKFVKEDGKWMYQGGDVNFDPKV